MKDKLYFYYLKKLSQLSTSTSDLWTLRPTATKAGQCQMVEFLNINEGGRLVLGPHFEQHWSEGCADHTFLWNLGMTFTLLSCPFILFMGFSKQAYRSSLQFPPPVDHVLSEVSTMTLPSCVALHGTAHSFIESHKTLQHNKAVMHEGESLKAKGDGVAEDEMVGWHHRLSGCECEQPPGESERRRSLVCCSPWGCRVRHHLATE